MKTLKILSTLLIIALSTSAFADGKPNRKNKKSRKAETSSMVVKLPEMEWGNPADVISPSVESLKPSTYVLEPEMVWGDPSDVQLKSVEALKNLPLIAIPAMDWGSPEDVNLKTVAELKTSAN